VAEHASNGCAQDGCESEQPQLAEICPAGKERRPGAPRRIDRGILIGRDDYLLSADGLLMPVKKGQKPPDLRYFNQPQQ
jgi:hypothetical protein